MACRDTLVAGFILTVVLLGMAASFTGGLVATHQSCASTSSSSTSSELLTNSTDTGNSSLGALPVPGIADDLVLSSLADLSLPQGNSSSISDLTNATFWGLVDSSELHTYEQIVPQTVLGFFNSSEEWRAWALQYVPDPPPWLATGIVAAAQSQFMTAGPPPGSNSSVVQQSVRTFAASVAGLSLASLDFVSFNGISALKTEFETGDSLQAACETLPGQLAQLYESSFDAGVPQGERADYLGRAIAITSVMLLLGGADGFADHLHGAVDGVGLADSWSTVKPYLGDIGTKASASAASAALGVLQTVAQRFPQDSVFATGFTGDRIDSMVEVLEKKGVSNDVIQNDIGQIAQVAGTSSDDEATGEAADVDSLQQGGGMQVYVRSGNKMVLYEDSSGDTATIRGTFLQQVIPGFDPRGPDFVQIHYREAGVTVYHYYPQKVAPGASYGPSDTNWLPVVPEGIASNGDVITISFSLLTPEQFVESIPVIAYDDVAGASWVADFSEITGFELAGNQIAMSVEQEPLEGVTDFVMAGQASPMTNVGGDTFIEFTVPDVVNQPENLKITYDGYGNPVLSFQSGDNFDPVSLVSSDGVKLKFVYDSGGDSNAVNTIYLQQPSVLWTLGSASEQDIGFVVQGASQTFKIAQVTPVRNLEWEMVNSGDDYDLARVGAEIAYTVGQEDFGLRGIQLNEPSQGGADLTAGGQTATIQTRMLGSTSALSSTDLEARLNSQLNSLAGQVRYDFSQNSKFTVGYAMLSYVDPTTKTIVTLVAVIPKT